MKTAAEIQLKINDCIENKLQYVEWLCENKTEMQLERLKNKIEKLVVVAKRENITEHIMLITLWQEHINCALDKMDKKGNLFEILKKIRRDRKLSSHEQLVVDCNYDWFVNKNYGLPTEEIKIVECE